MPVYAKFLGKRYGNFHPDQVSRGAIVKAIKGAKTGDNWPTKFFALRGYNGYDVGRVVLTSEARCWERWDDGFLATRSVASGIILEAPFQGGVIFTQGAISVCLYDLARKRLALLPMRYRCDERGLSEEGRVSLSKLFGWFGHLKAANVCVDLGWGNAPCCDRQNTQQEIVDHLERLGIARKRIAINSLCTVCAGHDTPEPDDDFHSSTVDGGGAGRNALVVWFADL